MLFTFDHAAEQQVWMAGMAIALDVAWIKGDQVIDVLTLTRAPRPSKTDAPDGPHRAMSTRC